MDLSLTDEQDAVVTAFASFFEKESTIDVVRGSEPSGYDADLWQRCQAVGLIDMALESPLLNLALVFEHYGRRLAPVPLLDACVASRVLGRPAPDATFIIAGQPLNMSGAVAREAIAYDGSSLWLAPVASAAETASNLGCAPAGDIHLGDDREVLATGSSAAEQYAVALAEWRALLAAALVGMAQGALDLGVSYVKERKQFDVPIGSFQSIQHRLADLASNLDGARLLAQKAAWGLDDAPHAAPSWARAAMALVFAADTAQQVSAASLHYHGGYGYTLEYDIQLYFRRAKGWPLFAGDPRDLLHEIGRTAQERH